MKPENSKLLGILGGLGPMATAYFYELLIAHTEAKCDQDHIDVVISGRATTPDRTEYILNGNGEDPFLYMVSDAKKLVDYGADVIAIPCNTAHYFYARLSENITVPIINIIYETVKTVSGLGCKKVGLFATEGTVKTKTYEMQLDKAGIDLLIPTDDEQRIISDVIYGSVKQGKKPDMEKFYSVAQSMKKKGCEKIILGCTELSVLKKDVGLDEYFIDSMEVLAKSTILFCGKTPVGFRGI